MSNEKFVVGPCRLSFPALFKPRPVSKGSEKTAFMATLLLPPDFDLTPLYEAIKAAAVEKFGKVVKFPARNNPIKPCSEKEVYGEEFDGWHYLNTKTQYQPAVVDQKVQPVLDESALYPGCWINAQIHAFAYSHDQGGKGVSFGLDMVQFVKDGDRLDNKANPGDVFKPVGASKADDSGDDAQSAADALFGS